MIDATLIANLAMEAYRIQAAMADQPEDRRAWEARQRAKADRVLAERWKRDSQKWMPGAQRSEPTPALLRETPFTAGRYPTR